MTVNTKVTFKIPLFFFWLSAGIGLFLRAIQSFGISGISFSNLLHAHSHITFLGWGFLGVLALIHRYYTIDFNPRFKFIWVAMNVSIIGMLATFPFFGYKLIPILFLIVFLVLSYLYLIQLLKKLKNTQTLDSKFIKWGIFYYFLSSAAVWVIPLIIVKLGKKEAYYDAIYFYLHFLYNGFFTFILWGFFLKYLKKNFIKVNERYFKHFFNLLNVACIPAFALSLYWHYPKGMVLFIGTFAAFLQFFGTVFLFKSLRNINLSKLHSKVISFVIIIFSIKIGLQLVSAFPDWAAKAISLKPYFVVGYIHLFTIGFMSLFLLWLYKFSQTVKYKFAIITLIIGFVFTEMALFYQGSSVLFSIPSIPHLSLWLFSGSLAMFLGISLVLTEIFTEKIEINELL